MVYVIFATCELVTAWMLCTDINHSSTFAQLCCGEIFKTKTSIMNFEPILHQARWKPGNAYHVCVLKAWCNT